MGKSLHEGSSAVCHILHAECGGQVVKNFVDDVNRDSGKDCIVFTDSLDGSVGMEIHSSRNLSVGMEIHSSRNLCCLYDVLISGSCHLLGGEENSLTGSCHLLGGEENSLR